MSLGFSHSCNIKLKDLSEALIGPSSSDSYFNSWFLEVNQCILEH